MPRKYIPISVGGVIVLCLLATLIYQLPPIHDRLSWRVDNMFVQVRRFFNPPEEVVFVPQEQVDAIVHATLTAMATTPTPLATVTPLASPIPTFTPTAIPERVELTGIRH